MKAVGIICEYNPFHNGHIYHIKKIKQLFPSHIIILVLSGPFTERSDPSILTKWEKTEIALTYGIDLVLELPFIFATGSADVFADGAIGILKEFQVEYLIFGSESNDIQKLTKLAEIQFDENFEVLVKENIAKGINYPSALSSALEKMTHMTLSSPNDLLGISYIKSIIKQKAGITPLTIQRTSDYHNLELTEIASASSIRKALKEKKKVCSYVPKRCQELLHYDIDIESFFPFLKYKIISEQNNLIQYHEVTISLISRMRKAILSSNSLDAFIHAVKTKSDTYSKIKRICLYILCGLTKEEAIFYKTHSYIRILGFTEAGKQYLNIVKKEITLPVISNYSNDKNHLLNLDLRIHQIYTMIFPQELKNQLLEEEIKHQPIYLKKSN